MVATGPRATSVAIRAHNLTLLDLVEDPLPVVALQGVTDRECLVSQMVELKHDGVIFTAIAARMRFEVLDQVPGSLTGDTLAQLTGLRDISLTVGAIVLAFVVGTTGPAIVVVLPLASTPPVEICDRKQDLAPPAAAQNLFDLAFPHTNTCSHSCRTESRQ